MWSLTGFGIGSFRGTRIKLHNSYPLYIILLLIWFGRAGGGPAMLYAAGFIAALTLSVLLHEIGHCEAAKFFGLDAEEIILWLLGGLAMVGHSREPKEEIGVAIAGPLVNLFLVAIGSGLVLLVGGSLTWDVYSPFGMFSSRSWMGLLEDTIRLNLLMGVLNLVIPALPIDGGRVLRGILWHFMGIRRAAMITGYAAYAVGGLVFAYSMYLLFTGTPALQVVMFALIGVFVVHTGHKMATKARYGEYDGISRSVAVIPQKSWSERREEEKERKARDRARAEAEKEQKRMDQLLAKISDSGLDSLTDEERKFLDEYSQRM
jgi:Zn-dependent protease